jgi:3-hydroxyanthranilate 3,4-dioxygenase
MSQLSAFNLSAWIDSNRDLLRPPLGATRLMPQGDFLVMAIGGPNERTDFHDNPSDEIFYQLEGDITLRVIEDGNQRDIPIKEGEMFFLPAHVPHSPQRPPDTVGVVVERMRKEGELEAFEWYCQNCESLVHRREFQLRNIKTDLVPVFEEYYGDAALRKCPECDHQNPGKPGS